MNTSLINKTRTKKFILTVANETHQTSMDDLVVDSSGRKWNMTRANSAMSGRKFTQVSQELLDEIDHTVRSVINKRVAENKQAGKTVR